MPALDFEKNWNFGEDGSGILYIATDYDGTTYADWTGANERTSIADIESDFTFADVGYFENFAPFIKKGEERIIMTDYCGVGEIARKVEKITWFTVSVQEILNMQNLAQILGAELQVVPAGVGVKWQEIIGMKRQMKTNTYQLFKFVSCPNALGLSNVFYFVKSVLNSDINIPYTNLAKDDFVWVDLEFENWKGWNLFIQKQTAPATS